MLATCSPVTPFSAYHSLAALSNFEHVIQESDIRFHDIYSSLHFFAKRWGVAGEFAPLLYLECDRVEMLTADRTIGEEDRVFLSDERRRGWCYARLLVPIPRGAIASR